MMGFSFHNFFCIVFGISDEELSSFPQPEAWSKPLNKSLKEMS